MHILSCDEIYVVRDNLRQQHVQLSTFWVLSLSSSQFWYGPEICQNTSKRRIDNSVGWVGRWNKSCCRARIFWLLRRMQPINVVQFYSIDNDISSKMFIFTENLDMFHMFSLSTITNRHFKFNTNTLSISTAKQLGWFQSTIFCFFATHSRFARNFPPAWQPGETTRSEKTWRWDPDVVEIYPSQSWNRMGNDHVWYLLVWIWILMLVEYFIYFFCLMYSAYIVFTYCVFSLHIISRYLSKRYIHI